MASLCISKGRCTCMLPLESLLTAAPAVVPLPIPLLFCPSCFGPPIVLCPSLPLFSFHHVSYFMWTSLTHIHGEEAGRRSPQCDRADTSCALPGSVLTGTPGLKDCDSSPVADEEPEAQQDSFNQILTNISWPPTVSRFCPAQRMNERDRNSALLGHMAQQEKKSRQQGNK